MLTDSETTPTELDSNWRAPSSVCDLSSKLFDNWKKILNIFTKKTNFTLSFQVDQELEKWARESGESWFQGSENIRINPRHLWLQQQFLYNIHNPYNT